MWTLPNLITLLRLILVPVVVLMLARQAWVSAFAAFVVAGLSDALDGYLARRLNQFSDIGAMLDPLADKTLLAVAYLMLALHEVIPAWLAVVVLGRDAMILIAIAIAWQRGIRIRFAPLLVSKLNTAAQIGFAGLVLAALASGVNPQPLVLVLAVPVAALTVLSTAAYVHRWWNSGRIAG